MDVSIGTIQDIGTIFSNDCVAQTSLAALNQPLRRVAGPATALNPVVKAAIAILGTPCCAGIIVLSPLIYPLDGMPVYFQRRPTA